MEIYYNNNLEVPSFNTSYDTNNNILSYLFLISTLYIF